MPSSVGYFLPRISKKGSIMKSTTTKSDINSDHHKKKRRSTRPIPVKKASKAARVAARATVEAIEQAQTQVRALDGRLKLLQKLHSRHCELEQCKVPFCLAYRHGNATREEREAAEAEVRAQYLRDHRKCWWPLCWFSCHRKSMCGRSQICVEDTLVWTAGRVQPGEDKKPQGAPSDFWNACSFIIGLTVIVTVLLIYT